MSLTIGVVIFDGAEELDIVGPYEVLAAWSDVSDRDVRVVTVSRDGEPVTCANRLRITPDHGWADCPPLDILIYPGGDGTRPHLVDDAVLDWVRERAAAASLTFSVCTGSLVLAAAGLLRDRPATTHWSALDLLARLDASVEVRPDDRYCDSGDVLTAAGVSAGIDAALHVVARWDGEDVARQVRRYIQYDPAPPV